jgi:predicted DNA-binding transcriptional regulator YafY
VLAPLALADTGLRWHLRAFDQIRDRFSDFVLTRITKTTCLNQSIPENQSLQFDTQWARVVHLELGPHPGVKHAEAIEADYGMRAGKLSLDIRAPLVGYALRRWAVDCSEGSILNPQEFQLRLLNLPTLYGVESAVLSPGYKGKSV